MNLLLGLPLTIFRMLGHFLLLALRFAPILLVLIPLGVKLWRRNHPKNQAEEPQEAPPPRSHRRGPKFAGPVYTVDYEEVDEEAQQAEPDAPQPFGQKNGWALVRCRDPEGLMDVLGLRSRKSANWKSGLAAVSDQRCFISPSLDGWVLLIGGGEKLLDRGELELLSRRYSEIQLFAAREDKALYGWAKFENGSCRRAYAMQGGQVRRDEGELTREEIRLGFGRFPRKNTVGCEGFPNRDAVLAIAAAWGLDPLMSENTYPLTHGWLCDLG